MRAERSALYVLQIPIDVRQRRGAEGVADAFEPEIDSLQDSERSQAHTSWAVSAQVFNRRMAAVVERAEGRDVAGGPAPGGPRRSSDVPNLAAAAVAHAPRINLLVGASWARPAGFRYLDEDGYAVHRQLVFGAGYQDSAADHPSGFDGVGGELAVDRQAAASTYLDNELRTSPID